LAPFLGGEFGQVEKNLKPPLTKIPIEKYGPKKKLSHLIQK
jgi:hypothetical protein